MSIRYHTQLLHGIARTPSYFHQTTTAFAIIMSCSITQYMETRTLNEFFNLPRLTSGDGNSISDGITESFVSKRNHDQVLSRVLRANSPNKQSWVLVNIDQLWIWVLDKSKLPNSTGHRPLQVFFISYLFR